MYNNHLVDLYKLTGNYILDIINHRRAPRTKVFTPEEEAMMLANNSFYKDDDDDDDEGEIDIY